MFELFRLFVYVIHAVIHNKSCQVSRSCCYTVWDPGSCESDMEKESKQCLSRCTTKPGVYRRHARHKVVCVLVRRETLPRVLMTLGSQVFVISFRCWLSISPLVLFIPANKREQECGIMVFFFFNLLGSISRQKERPEDGSIKNFSLVDQQTYIPSGCVLGTDDDDDGIVPSIQHSSSVGSVES